jgi:hypothetical protein
MEELCEFLGAHHTNWPRGRLETQTFELSLEADAKPADPLFDDEFLRTADVVCTAVRGPNLKVAVVSDLMQRVRACVREDGVFRYDVEPAATLDRVHVRIIAARNRP